MTGATARSSVRMRSIVLGEGRPQICVPLVGATIAELAAAASGLIAGDYDLVELRIDFFSESDIPAAVREAIAVVRAALPEGVPVIFTFRTKREGGQRDILPEAYADLLGLAIAAGVDAVDVELFTERSCLLRIVSAAHEAGVLVVMSSHDFESTPPRAEILARFAEQQALGADVLKLAVMPSSPRDVLTLMDATAEFVAEQARRPVIAMSMGGLGVVSRLAGETFGSCVTFGSVGASSAPGQIEASELRAVLDLVHGAR
ncbi:MULTISPECIES: type I 3-dehydroquinate dehydratase [unclassified Cryobacterium]|uniref:type I 3-dehydroquinate dehydratase n=2 Tax=Cryobacterium TaxID=69578 RepID=UPI002AB3E553|nr:MULTISPECIES: type I 3-dehydroquinate dehydratase [unclassified Cryobacterium]MDY7527347.1 type I 3-dehydroquinate dehydratase [Cryobacterium sp. 10C2]MEB0002275.1 type I 3-dehydroquinate dehydratase [Cryobacterium sp. RTC2.1]MEB0202391.1 type I 3-dehydroquinate dehydratase [Cryobacterium sp. 5I3]MEB0287379.1 type I 3-dehydroquinate dehydratase [Cryobacterium sp. 10S3]MEB0290459.1 type I 3-dehydroquinate dehydratase [Cryobacterium sp. 10C2]